MVSSLSGPVCNTRALSLVSMGMTTCCACDSAGESSKQAIAIPVNKPLELILSMFVMLVSLLIGINHAVLHHQLYLLYGFNIFGRVPLNGNNIVKIAAFYISKAI